MMMFFVCFQLFFVRKITIKRANMQNQQSANSLLTTFRKVFDTNKMKTAQPGSVGCAVFF